MARPIPAEVGQFPQGAEGVDGLGDLFGSAEALDVDRADQHAHLREASSEDREDVVEGGPIARGDDADGLGIGRERTFVDGREKPLVAEPLLEGFEGLLHRPLARQLHRPGHQLQLASDFVDRRVAVQPHKHPVLRIEQDVPGETFPHYAAHLGVFILQRKVAMARPIPAEVGQFPFDPYVVEVRLDDFFEATDEVADATNGVIFGRSHGRLVGRMDKIKHFRAKRATLGL